MYCLTFVGCFDWRSCELFVSLLMKGFLKYCTRLISTIILRWSNDDIYPNDGIPQAVINWDVSLEHNTKSIILEPIMNVLGLFLIPWWWDIGSISLYFDHNRTISPLLQARGSLASISVIISCFSLTRSLMKSIKWGTVRNNIDSIVLDLLLRIVHCWVDASSALVGYMGPLHTL